MEEITKDLSPAVLESVKTKLIPLLLAVLIPFFAGAIIVILLKIIANKLINSEGLYKFVSFIISFLYFVALIITIPLAIKTVIF